MVSDTVKPTRSARVLVTLLLLGTDATGSYPSGIAVDPLAGLRMWQTLLTTRSKTYTINQSTGDLTSVGTDATRSNPSNATVDQPVGLPMWQILTPDTVSNLHHQQSTGDWPPLALMRREPFRMLSQLIQPVGLPIWQIVTQTRFKPIPSTRVLGTWPPLALMLLAQILTVWRLILLEDSRMSRMSVRVPTKPTPSTRVLGTWPSVGTDATGSSPTFVAVDPTGRYVYVTNAGPETVQTFVINQSTGDLTSVESDSTGTKSLGLFAVDPTGRFVIMWLITVIALCRHSVNNFSAGSGSFAGRWHRHSSPTALLNLAAGTSSVAPLKLTSGTNLGTAQTGAFGTMVQICTSLQ